jgi:plasmid stabilization system protein ParE
MPEFLVQKAAACRIDEIYRYTLENWGKTQADAYVEGLFAAFGAIDTPDVLSRPIPAEFGVEGFFFQYRKHFVYWKYLSSGIIGIATVLHERMHLISRLKDDFDFSHARE